MNKKLSAFILTLFFTVLIFNKTVTNGTNYMLKVDELGDFSITNSVAKMEYTANGLAISPGSWEQEVPIICSDGADGAIIVWSDYRSSSYPHLYAQKINSTGSIQWTTDGVAICTINNYKHYKQICSDGAGGAIIIWADRRNGNDYDIYAQKINSSGNVQWGNGTPGDFNGTPICTAINDQEDIQICDVGSAAAITWEDNRSGSDIDIYAQKIESNGMVKWGANGTAICTAIDNQYDPKICNDGSGGAIITWEDRQFGSWDILAQRIDWNGNVIWNANGTKICTAFSSQRTPEICSDGFNGAIITWMDDRSFDRNLYAQKINSTGSGQWTPNGTAICMASDSQGGIQTCMDGAGGAIITWRDYRSGIYSDIYVQKINSTGNVQWTIDGVAICTAINNQGDLQICWDGTGGAIITWVDYRSGSNWDIYAQKINSTNVRWRVDGVAICSLNNDQYSPRICWDGSDGAIITWSDDRNTYNDIFAQKVTDVQRETPDNVLLLFLIAVMSTDDGFLGLSIEIWIIIGIAAAVVVIIVLIKKRS